MYGKLQVLEKYLRKIAKTVLPIIFIAIIRKSTFTQFNWSSCILPTIKIDKIYDFQAETLER
jgi:hypothetical protein